jgi:hypothetical protein
VRLPRADDDVGDNERRSEATWIAHAIERGGGVAPPSFVEEVLELHQAYLSESRVPLPRGAGAPPMPPPRSAPPTPPTGTGGGAPPQHPGGATPSHPPGGAMPPTPPSPQGPPPGPWQQPPRHR